MRVKELKELIKDLPDNTPVMEVGDGNLYHSHIRVDTGLYNRKDDEWVEDYGEEITPEAIHGKRRTVLMVGQ